MELVNWLSLKGSYIYSISGHHITNNIKIYNNCSIAVYCDQTELLFKGMIYYILTSLQTPLNETKM